MSELTVTTTPEEIAKRKRRSTLVLIVISIFALFGFLAFWFFGLNPKIVVSKETTHITAPLAADGYPDYHAVMLADMKQGTTPENNGAIPFVRTYWSKIKEELEPEQRKWLLNELGIEEPSPRDSLMPIDTPANRLGALEVLRKRLKRPEPDANDLLRQQVGESDPNEILFKGPVEEAVKDSRVRYLFSCCEPVGRPWTEEELPFLADWLELNREVLDQLLEGLESESWYLPICPPSTARGDLFNTYYYSQGMRDAARKLMTRSMFYLGKQQYDKAARDAMATLALAKYTAKGPIIVDRLVANAVAEMAYNQIRVIAGRSDIPEPVLRNLLNELNRGPIDLGYTKCLDEGERYFGLQMALGNDRDQFFENLWGEDDTSSQIAKFVSNRMSVDWNPLLISINRDRDRLVAISKLPTWKQREDAMDAYNAKIQNNAQDLTDPATLVSALLSPTRRGKALADYQASMENYWESILTSGFELKLDFELTCLSVALALYRAEHDKYPESLEELTPNLIPKVPVDAIQNNPFQYRRITEEGYEGYLIYSLGVNGVDDGGSSQSGSSSFYQESFQGIVPEQYEAYEDDLEWDLIPVDADDYSYRLPKIPAPWPWENSDFELE